MSAKILPNLLFRKHSLIYNSNIISAELLANGNFTGFSYGRGYEFTIDSEIVFETFIA